MSLPPFLTFLIGLATLAPLFAFLVPAVFMAFVAIGLWDSTASLLLARIPSAALESAGWNAALCVASLLAILHIALLVFYACHLATNHRVLGPDRLGFTLGFLILPQLAMPVYWVSHVLPASHPRSSGILRQEKL